MRTYKQSITFRRDFEIQAKDAYDANNQLCELIRQAEFDADVENEGYYEFEDEPVECPKCQGSGCIDEGEHTCDRCNGDGCIPFVASEEKP